MFYLNNSFYEDFKADTNVDIMKVVRLVNFNNDPGDSNLINIGKFKYIKLVLFFFLSKKTILFFKVKYFKSLDNDESFICCKIIITPYLDMYKVIYIY